MTETLLSAAFAAAVIGLGVWIGTRIGRAHTTRELLSSIDDEEGDR